MSGVRGYENDKCVEFYLTSMDASQAETSDYKKQVIYKTEVELCKYISLLRSEDREPVDSTNTIGLNDV